MNFFILLQQILQSVQCTGQEVTAPHCNLAQKPLEQLSLHKATLIYQRNGDHGAFLRVNTEYLWAH